MNFERLTPIRFEEIDSTNAEAMRMLKRSKPMEGSCVVADFQSEGRGQRSNIWSSRPGENLLVSFILYPRSPMVNQPFQLSKAIALAVHSTIASFTKGKVQIKWPNDILIDGKKAAGILIENQWAGSNWQAAIAGIGINVNQTEFAIEKATSLGICNDRAIALDEVLPKLQRCISQEYARLCDGLEASISNDYHEKLFGKDEYHTFENAQGQVIAKVQRVADDGRLELLSQQGESLICELSEIRLLY
jgi:BirA family biotin operon repressor/biotin-[acetyl-CoA-carboxylase] ligase